MKTNILTRLCALAMSAVFASMATVGVAVMMTANGEQVQTAFSANAAARQDAQPATLERTHWQAPAIVTKQVL